jgi:hypothetical protein
MLTNDKSAYIANVHRLTIDVDSYICIYETNSTNSLSITLIKRYVIAARLATVFED